MKTPEFIGKIHEAVIDNRLEDALYELKKMATDIDTQTATVLLMSRLNDLKRDEQLGISDDRASDKELNRIRLAVLELLNKISAQEDRENLTDENAVLQDLMEALEINSQTFVAQSRIRNKLTTSLHERIPDLKRGDVVKLIAGCYDQMTPEERRMHHTIRGYTKNVIKTYNEEALKILKANPKIKNKIKRLKKLEQHIIIWLSKYESTFENDESVCLVYVGVQERVPFPKGIEDDIREYLELNP